MDDTLLQQVNALAGRNALTITVAESVLQGRTIEETVAQLMFGRPLRYWAGLWIASMTDEEALMFNAAMFNRWARATKRKVGQVNADLVRFKDLGMVLRFDPKNPPTSGQWYTRCKSPLWDIFLMADVVITEIMEPQQRRFYTPSAARQERMVHELMQIFNDTSATPVPASPPPVPRPGNYRARGPNGELRCSRCKQWKPERSFSPRPRRPGLFKSHCKDCMADQARIRYLSVRKMEALNAAGLTFTVSGSDDVVGLSCVGCGRQIVTGDIVYGDMRLCHVTC